jgi:predicted N-acetyltransferase YhbS
MSTPPALTRAERPDDDAAIPELQRASFGPGAYARVAFRVREQAPHDLALSFVTELEGALIGSVRLTPIAIGDREGLLLGPLVVDLRFKGLGYGKALVRHALSAARDAGADFVILVGDLPYYGPLGFKRLPPKSVMMPGPVDPERLLVAELRENAPAELRGMIRGRRGTGT